MNILCNVNRLFLDHNLMSKDNQCEIVWAIYGDRRAQIKIENLFYDIDFWCTIRNPHIYNEKELNIHALHEIPCNETNEGKKKKKKTRNDEFVHKIDVGFTSR